MERKFRFFSLPLTNLSFPTLSRISAGPKERSRNFLRGYRSSQCDDERASGNQVYEENVRVFGERE